MNRVEVANKIVMQVIADREAGKQILDAQILAEHPDLRPELIAALEFSSRIDEGLRGRVRPFTSVRLVPMTDDELDAPIELSEVAASSAAPQIDGFEILELIGCGGQATVYKGRQWSTGRHVAIKVLPGGQFALPRSQVRFDREAAILAKLDHSGIVGIVDRGRTKDGSWYIAMPLVDGVELDVYLASRRDLRTILSVFFELSLAVGEAHAQGVVHRDLKPSNIRIDRHGRPHVLDFGLARLLQSGRWIADSPTMTVDRQVIGSLPSASPEQVRGDLELDARSDVYSIGLMLYAAIAGEPAVRHDLCLPDYLRSVMQRTPPPPSKLKSRVVGAARAVDGLVMKCLAKAPSERFQTGRELAAAISDLQSGRLPLRNRKSLLQRIALLGTAVAAAALIVPNLLGYPESPSGRSTVLSLPRRVDGADIDFVKIPTGQTWPAGGTGQPILVQSFWISTTEITQGQFAKVMQLPNPVDPGMPAAGVLQTEAVAFCERLSKSDGLHCRLPTLDEWMYAARAGNRLSFASNAELDPYAWTRTNAAGILHPVMQKRSNLWGLYDVWGNVEEMCVRDDGQIVMAGGSYCSSSLSQSTPLLPATQARDAGFRVVSDEK